MSTRLKIKTTEGEIIVALYDETPKHRDNFIKLAKEGYFDGTLFHRVIKDFMIQGGDPNSKDAEPGQMLGTGGLAIQYLQNLSILSISTSVAH